MPLISSTLPFADTGSLFGGIRTRVAEVLGLKAEAVREANQNQDVSQSGRAFSGAQVTNDLTQTEHLSQEATAENVKDITIDSADIPASGIPSGFDFNFLQRVLTQVDAGNLLSRGALNLNQRQRVTQSGFAQGVDFDGNPSRVTNTITQDNTDTTQTATSRVKTNIMAQRDPETENAARFRDLLIEFKDSTTEAFSTAVQDQGSSLDDASVQVGRANGGIVNNTLNQLAGGTQTNNVFMENTIDARMNAPETTLSPRSTSRLVHIENDVVRNYATAAQMQGLMQIAEGGVDEFGNPTENGGQVHNVSNQSASFAESSAAVNTTTILV